MRLSHANLILCSTDPTDIYFADTKKRVINQGKGQSATTMLLAM